MNTRGIMFKFLLTVILAIIIFAPACILTSKLFRLSAQAEENFADLAEALKAHAKKAAVGEFTGMMVILDDGTYIAKFNRGEDLFLYPTLQLNSPQGIITVREKITIPYPVHECKGKDCLALCQVQEFEPQMPVFCEKILAIPLGEGTNIAPFVISRFSEINQLKVPLPTERRTFVRLVTGMEGDKTIIRVLGEKVELGKADPQLDHSLEGSGKKAIVVDTGTDYDIGIQ